LDGNDNEDSDDEADDKKPTKVSLKDLVKPIVKKEEVKPLSKKEQKKERAWRIRKIIIGGRSYSVKTRRN